MKTAFWLEKKVPPMIKGLRKEKLKQYSHIAYNSTF